jgi:hypothetical protein
LGGLFIVMAVITWLYNLWQGHRGIEDAPAVAPAALPFACCGAHSDCDFKKMQSRPDEIVYFDDDELDRFAGRAANAYSADEIAEFREVLYTLQADEIRMWLLSIERRGLTLPSILRQEALMLL